MLPIVRHTKRVGAVEWFQSTGFCSLIRLVLLTISILSCAGNSAFAEGPTVSCGFVKEAILDASTIRGLKILKPVPCKMQNQNEVRSFLVDSIEKKIPRERIRGEEISFKLLGFIPFDYDYLSGLIDLYTSQLGGYYDPETKSYAMASWMPQVVQYPIAVHELTHALQDQHYNLKPLLDSASLSSDTQLAYSALFEGDAMAVMLDHTNGQQGRKSLAKMDDISSIILQNVLGASLSLTANATPPSLELYLLFPYSSGLNFVHRLLRDDGYKAVDRAYRNLPRSSTEILHPEKYKSGKFKPLVFKNEPPTDILRALDISDFKPIHQDTLGEFFISTLLSQYIPTSEATLSAQGWQGDRLYLYETTQRTQVTVWDTRWETPESASRFFRSLKAASEKRLHRKSNSSTGDEFSLTNESIWIKANWQANSVVLTAGGNISPAAGSVNKELSKL